MIRWRRFLSLSTSAVTLILAAWIAKADEQRCAHPRASPMALKASLYCDSDLRRSTKPPVLLVHGTYGSPESFAWNYEPALRTAGWPICTVALPANGTASIATSALYIEYAIRTAFRMSGRKVQVLGFSQGGMAPRWTLRFSPEIRAMVDDLIAISASNHGALLENFLCDIAPSTDLTGTVGCPAAAWQQRPESHFLARLNSHSETVPEIDYTSIYSTFDGVIGLNDGPDPASAIRSTGANVANISLQQVCPASTTDHLESGFFDPVAYAIALDALEHPGPASLDRVLQGAMPGSPGVCGAIFMPGINPLTFVDDFNDSVSALLEVLAHARNTEQEPALPCDSIRRAGMD
jgi:pimeloyl-ACP methyl ester carboxylesterase